MSIIKPTRTPAAHVIAVVNIKLTINLPCSRVHHSTTPVYALATYWLYRFLNFHSKNNFPYDQLRGSL